MCNSCLQLPILNCVKLPGRFYEGIMADHFRFLLSDIIPQSITKRIVLLGPDHERRQTFEFLLRIEGAENAFANLHIERALSGERLCRMSYSEYAVNELHLSGWRVCLKLSPTTETTIQSLCRNIYNSHLGSTTSNDATEGSIDWAIGWWT